MSSSKQSIQSNLGNFDFEEWSSLASNDPETFEQRRQDCIDNFINRYPDSRQKRLRGLQFRIDMERKLARTPMAACIKLSSMMWDAITKEDGFVSTVKLLNNDRQAIKKQPTISNQSATILSFHRKNTKH